MNMPMNMTSIKTHVFDFNNLKLVVQFRTVFNELFQLVRTQLEYIPVLFAGQIPHSELLQTPNERLIHVGMLHVEVDSLAIVEASD